MVHVLLIECTSTVSRDGAVKETGRARDSEGGARRTPPRRGGWTRATALMGAACRCCFCTCTSTNVGTIKAAVRPSEKSSAAHVTPPPSITPLTPLTAYAPRPLSRSRSHRFVLRLSTSSPSIASAAAALPDSSVCANVGTCWSMFVFVFVCACAIVRVWGLQCNGLSGEFECI